MAAIQLKIGQNSPMHTLKLKFEAVVLIDCMFLAYDEDGGIQIWSLIPDEPIKVQDGRQKIQNCDTIKENESHVGNIQFWVFNNNHLSI